MPRPSYLLLSRSAAETPTTSAKAVTLGGARYIVCINHQEAAKDAADRTAILAALERQLRRGDKALVGNTGFRRFLKTVGDGHFAIDRSKADEDARFDGVFVLRTNTDLNPLAAMLPKEFSGWCACIFGVLGGWVDLRERIRIQAARWRHSRARLKSRAGTRRGDVGKASSH